MTEQTAPEYLVAFSAMRGGWCVYDQASKGDYTAKCGPFPCQDQAIDAADELKAAALGAQGDRT